MRINSLYPHILKHTIIRVVFFMSIKRYKNKFLQMTYRPRKGDGLDDGLFDTIDAIENAFNDGFEHFFGKKKESKPADEKKDDAEKPS